MEKSLSKYSELFALVRNGYLFRETPKLRGKRAYFYFISKDGKEKKNYKIDNIDPDEFDELCDELTQFINDLHGASYYGRKTNSEEKPEKNFVKVQQSLKEMDKTFALQIMNYAKRQQWFSEVLERLGISTLFMILQLANIPPEQWYEQIQNYREDPDAFMKFADKYLVALFEAKQDAEKIMEWREKFIRCIGRESVLEVELVKYKKSLQDTIESLKAATSLLSESQLKRYTLWIAMQKMARASEITVGDVEKG